MPTVGPTLPPHLLAKRKRADEGIDGESSSTSSSVSSTTPSPESDTKRRRVIGPAPPPAPLEEQPAEPPSDVEGSSEDDGYGPTLPHEDAKDDHKIPEVYSTSAFITTPQEDRAGSKKTQRDEWMMMPPKQDELQARMDPTKIRARKFNTSKNAKGPNESRDGESSVWTETPEQKRQRLQDQVMGVSTSASGGNTSQSQTVARSKARDEQNKQRIREHNEKHGSKSLYEQHHDSSGKIKEEDDPSKRAFDYEKDMVSGKGIGRKQQRELLSRASNMSSKFSGGSYL